ncbi:MAG: DNA cytosine methyltransferase [Candidatus Binatia bacterium]
MLKEVTKEVAFPLAAVKTSTVSTKLPFLDFFAGSGLVTAALKPYFTAVWANDICPKKATVYRANHPRENFHLGSIDTIEGKTLPRALLSWASFPCQDLSLAGNQQGISSTRSGLVWCWLRVMDDMLSRPPIVVAENVVGLVSARGGMHYRRLHRALVERGYRVGALAIDARHWTPQSRPRIFVVGVDQSVDITGLRDHTPGWAHSRAIQKAADKLPNWIWWRLPAPTQRTLFLKAVIDFHTPSDDSQRTAHNLSLIPPAHRERLASALQLGETVIPGYKRTRNGRQVLELRFDGVAGCLRTPEGGSSRQVLVIAQNGALHTRLLTVQEAARLMGAPKCYKIPGSYNDGYKAMGDAVAVPAVRFLAQSLLYPLALRL